MARKANFGNPVSVAPLRRTQIEQAFPLVREAVHGLMLDQWVGIARHAFKKDTGAGASRAVSSILRSSADRTPGPR